jgi:hypothetical protein
MAHVRWEKGGEADLIKLEGEAIVLRSSIPSPPGSRLVGALTSASGELRVKVHTSRRQPDGGFVLEGRLIDTTRELRLRLIACVVPQQAEEASLDTPEAGR